MLMSPSSSSSYFRQWFAQPGRAVVAGAVVALALIPEAIAFSLIAGLARKVSQLLVITSTLSPDGTARTYAVHGQLFFVSASTFADAFDFHEVLERVVIDASHAHFWDLTAIGALDRVVIKYRREGTPVELLGLNEASKTIVDRLAIHDKPGAMDEVATH